MENINTHNCVTLPRSANLHLSSGMLAVSSQSSYDLSPMRIQEPSLSPSIYKVEHVDSMITVIPTSKVSDNYNTLCYLILNIDLYFRMGQ